MVLSAPVITDRIGESHAVRVRDGTWADVGSVVDLHMKTFPDFPTTQLGRGFMMAFYGAFVGTPEDVFRVACNADGAILGFGAGSTEPRRHYQRFYGTHLLMVTWAVLRCIARDPAFVLRLLWRMPRLIDALLSRLCGAAYQRGTAARNGGHRLVLLFLAVAQPARGGVGNRLVADFQMQGEARNCTVLELDTDIRNKTGRRFFERLGFTGQNVGSIVQFSKRLGTRHDA
jgi:ribosomal protein S18 acetylase RimI-like enzyme